MGIAVNRNNCVIPHKDFRDGWAVMCCFGDFTGYVLYVSTSTERCTDLKATELATNLFTYVQARKQSCEPPTQPSTCYKVSGLRGLHSAIAHARICI